MNIIGTAKTDIFHTLREPKIVLGDYKFDFCEPLATPVKPLSPFEAYIRSLNPADVIMPAKDYFLSALPSSGSKDG